MSNVVNFPNESANREQAVDWISRLDRGLRPEERPELKAWLDADASRQGILLEYAELWDRMDVLSELSELFPLEARQPAAWKNTDTWYLKPMTLAAVGVFVMLGALALYNRTSLVERAGTFMTATRDMSSSYQTAIGEQRSVVLPDKSVITLNTDTLVHVRYTGSDRLIELVQGEANFEVAKHDPRVFSVSVGESQFKAVGTAFNIRVSTERGVALTVTEGRVKVLPNTKAAVKNESQTALAGRATEILVDAGSAVALGEATQIVEMVTPDKMEAITSWKRGMIDINDQTLEQAILEVSRYSNLKFVIPEESVRQIPVSGYFKIGDIDGLIAALRTNFDVNASRQGDTITLSTQHAL
ncbi:MAG: FecR domain-containing protein [Steroidobacteraceae bacterium]